MSEKKIFHPELLEYIKGRWVRRDRKDEEIKNTMEYEDIVKDWSGQPLGPKGEDPSFDPMMKDLIEDKPFAFSRWGDGEWMAVLDGKKDHQANADGAIYYDDLRKTLREILLSRPGYKLGLQNFAWGRMPQIEEFVINNKLQDLNWVTSDALHRANMVRPKQMETFFEILNTKDVVLVGPEFLGSVDKFRFDRVVVPEKTAWLNKEVILEEIINHLSMYNQRLWLFACGMTTNWLIHNLAEEYPSEVYGLTLLDVGSLLDPYAGVSSRSYHDDVIKRL